MTGSHHPEDLLRMHSFTAVSRYLKASRSSRLEVFCKKGVPKNFPKFTGKLPVPESLLLPLVVASGPAAYLKKDTTTDACIPKPTTTIWTLNGVSKILWIVTITKISFSFVQNTDNKFFFHVRNSFKQSFEILSEQ